MLRCMSQQQSLDDQLSLVYIRLVDDFAELVGENEVQSSLTHAIDDIGDARVTTYVPVLVEKKVRQRLRALAHA